MKKIIPLIVVLFTMSSCLWVPVKMKPYQKRLWIHQNFSREYYFKTHPTQKEKVKRGKKYTPYFRNGRW